MLRNIFCIFTIAFFTVFLFPVAVLTLLLTLSGDASMWWCQRVWAPLMIFASGAKIQIVGGAEHLDPKRPVIFLSNHQSTLDIPVLFITLWPVRVRMVAKKVVKYVPFLGWYIWLAGFVFINRGIKREAIQSLDEAAEKIRKGTSILLYAEGTRSETGEVLPFKKGPFMLALKAKVPVIPVTIVGTEVVMPKNSWNITPAPVKVKIGAPIDPTKFGDDRDALMKAVRDVVIDQSIELGGKGGDKNRVLARSRDDAGSGQQSEASA